MTENQIQARRQIKKCSKYLTGQESKTLNGLIKCGNIIGAMNGLQTILARKLNPATHRENKE